MNECEMESLLGRYHDQALSPAQRRQVEQHIAVCAPCRAALQEMQAISAALRAAVMPQSSPEFIARLQALAGDVRDVTVVRFVGRLTAAAAAIILATFCYSGFQRVPVRPALVLDSEERMAVDPESAMPAASEDGSTASALPQSVDFIMQDLPGDHP